MSYLTPYKICGVTCLLIGLVATSLFLASVIAAYVVINSNYYYQHDPYAVKYKMVKCCQLLSLTDCHYGGRGALFCKATVRQPTNLQSQIDLIQNSNSQYYGLKTDEEKYEKRSQINAPFYFDPQNASLIEYYSPDYPRNLWLDFNCRALVEYLKNGTNSEMTSSFTDSNYPNLSQFNKSLSLSFVDREIRGSYRTEGIQLSTTKTEQVGSFINCYVNANQDELLNTKHSDMYKHLSAWGGASIAFTVLSATVALMGIIALAIVCSKERE